MQKLLIAAALAGATMMFAFSGQPARADADDGPKAKQPGECGFQWFWDEKKHMCVDAKQ